MTTLPTLHPFPEVAKRLGISLRSLRERSWARQFDHVRIGRERYFTEAQLAAFIDAMTVPSQRSSDLAKTAERVARRQQRRRAA
ncbi:DNA-binding protein [Micromonospora fluostatini]|uniref:DNA-binding protein n=1 Tax=Micromonospora fluostatini TaxID=1629071 RepID=A0ABY2DFC6_9ACTN|nr:DNA-binding protein [Micromonospora fluostatini]